MLANTVEYGLQSALVSYTIIIHKITSIWGQKKFPMLISTIREMSCLVPLKVRTIYQRIINDYRIKYIIDMMWSFY